MSSGLSQATEASGRFLPSHSLLLSTEPEGWINPKASSPSFHAAQTPGHRVPSLEGDLSPSTLRARTLWRRAISRVLIAGRLSSADTGFPNFDYSAEALAATRYSYDVDTDRFVPSSEYVKIEREPFAKGSIRRVYRCKKLSKWIVAKHHGFEQASCFVAKDYPRAAGNAEQLTKTDVKLQMTAKSLAGKWNLTAAPRKV